MNEMTVYGLERLEDRVLMAVDVTLNRSTLTITGDDDNNNIAMFEYDGELIVAVDEDADGTYDEYYSFDSDDVRSIRVNTGDGDDYVSISNVDINAKVSVNLGDGYDTFYAGYEAAYAAADAYLGDGTYAVGEVSLRSLSVDAGDGADYVFLYDTDIDSGLTVKAGEGDDSVSVRALYSDVEIGGKFKVDLGDGDNDLYVNAYNYDVTFEGQVDVGGGNDDDYIFAYANGADITFEQNVKLDGRGGDNEILTLEAGGDVDFEGKLKSKNFDEI